MNVGIVILLLYTMGLLGIAYYASLQDKKSISHFATADSSLGVFVLTLTLLSPIIIICFGGSRVCSINMELDGG